MAARLNTVGTAAKGVGRPASVGARACGMPAGFCGCAARLARWARRPARHAGGRRARERAGRDRSKRAYLPKARFACTRRRRDDVRAMPMELGAAGRPCPGLVPASISMDDDDD
jgi:hypothetical protein